MPLYQIVSDRPGLSNYLFFVSFIFVCQFYLIDCNVCFPGTTTNSDQYDVTLLICLLRNIAEPPIIKPVTGFDKLPQSHDTSEGADLARIKYYRNVLAHPADAGTSNDDFNNAWDNLSQVCV